MTEEDNSDATTKPPPSMMRRRKLRALVISMGSPRKEQIEELFAQPSMQEHFEPPAFSPGVPSRSLRNRFEFLHTAHEAGLLPEAEWQAIQKEQTESTCGANPEKYFDCLKDVPVTTEGRRGSSDDIKLHYSVELWRKSKSINRGRAVLGCTLAHLIAIKRCVAEGYDFILEDNVRAPPESCADRIWEAMEASLECSEGDSGSENNTIQGNNHNDGKTTQCHFRFIGWLGSLSNLDWIYNLHSKKRAHVRIGPNSSPMSVFPFPTPNYLDDDMNEIEAMTSSSTRNGDEAANINKDEDREHEKSPTEIQAARKPGGNPVWGAYAYWISPEGYQSLLDRLRKDVGAMLWRGKRMRYYQVKPVDKILPRLTMATFGDASVHIPTHPAFFRAPMLTSKIHTQWDPEFCKSTEYQLGHCGLDWTNLWLSEKERAVVAHRVETGEWLTPTALEQL